MKPHCNVCLVYYLFVATVCVTSHLLCMMWPYKPLFSWHITQPFTIIIIKHKCDWWNVSHSLFRPNYCVLHLLAEHGPTRRELHASRFNYTSQSSVSVRWVFSLLVFVIFAHYARVRVVNVWAAVSATSSIFVVIAIFCHRPISEKRHIYERGVSAQHNQLCTTSVLYAWYE